MLRQTRSHRLALIALGSLAVVTMSCGGSSPTGPSSSSEPTTFLSLVSVPGDQIGNGFTQRVGLSEAIFSARSYYGGANNSRQLVRIGVSPKDGTMAWWWNLMLSMPEGEPLHTGTYEGVKRWVAAGKTEAGMDFSGSGAGCSFLTGRFVIDELVLGASDATTPTSIGCT